MLGERLRRLRLARGMSLDGLHAAIGGMVSKQALSKYERGKMQPSARILNRIASALGVKSVQLWGEPACHVECLAYRKYARLGKKEQDRIQSFVTETLEKRVWLLDRIGERTSLNLAIRVFPINSLDDAEEGATTLREKWNLGVGPITNLVNVLEVQYIHIIRIEASDKFDGISAVARDGEDNELAAAIATRQGTSGDRDRLNVAHELGHLTLKPSEEVDEEKAAFRFGAAFLAPAEQLRRDVGEKRRHIPLEELVYLKRRYGMSMQALLFRMRNLDVITTSHYRRWCIDINKLGWKKREPIEIPPEMPERFDQQVFRALSERLIGEREAEQLLGATVENSPLKSLTERTAFLELPTNLRRNVLREQARRMANYYQNNSEWSNDDGGDYVEKEPA